MVFSRICQIHSLVMLKNRWKEACFTHQKQVDTGEQPYLDVDHEPLWFLLLALGVVVRILLVELRVVHIRLFDDLHHSSDARGLLREKNANFLQISWVSEKNHPIPFIRKSATFARFENEFRDLEIQFCPFLERVFINFYCFPQENAVSKRPL